MSYFWILDEISSIYWDSLYIGQDLCQPLHQQIPTRLHLLKVAKLTMTSPLQVAFQFFIEIVFSLTTTTPSGPTSFMAICTWNISNMRKVEMGAKKDWCSIFTSAASTSYRLMTYIGLIHHHITEYGMNTMFYFHTHDGTLVSILKGHSQFIREEFGKQSAEQYKIHDDTDKTSPLKRYIMYNLQNIRSNSVFVLASILPALPAQVLIKPERTMRTDPLTECMS